MQISSGTLAVHNHYCLDNTVLEAVKRKQQEQDDKIKATKKKQNETMAKQNMDFMAAYKKYKDTASYSPTT
jgi:metal-responsive CopG/Arc/MetJ family transcriptional regulator